MLKMGDRHSKKEIHQRQNLCICICIRIRIRIRYFSYNTVHFIQEPDDPPLPPPRTQDIHIGFFFSQRIMGY